MKEAAALIAATAFLVGAVAWSAGAGGGGGSLGNRNSLPQNQTQNNADKKTFKQIQVDSLQLLRLNDPFLYAARPNFSHPKLSPDGKRLALIARLPDSQTTLLVVDVSGNNPTPIGRVDVPYMLGVRDYGWASVDQLVMWIDIDTTQFADDFQPSALYVAGWDLRTKKITERRQPVRGENDLSSPYPISSELVRAPWGSAGHALINECSRAGMGGVKQRTRTLDSGFTFTQQFAVPSNTILCSLFDWDVAKNVAKRVAQPFYGYPVRFFASGSGTRIKAEGVETSGKLMLGEWDADRKRWKRSAPVDPGALLAETDSSEEDYSEQWRAVHEQLPQDLEPLGTVLQTAETGRPVGIQFVTPQHSLATSEPKLASADTVLRQAMLNAPAMHGLRLAWEHVTDSLDLAALSVDSSDYPGAYLRWRATDRSVLAVTDQRQLAPENISKTTLHADWLEEGAVLGVTTPLRGQTSRGLLIMPVIASDAAAAASLISRFNSTVQWFAANGMTVAQVAVPLPGPEANRMNGAAWRAQVGERVAEAREQVLQRQGLGRTDPVCLLGQNANAYAVLSAVANSGAVSCAVAVNPQLDPKLLRPWARVSALGRVWYLNGDNTTLNTWRRLYGGRDASGAGLANGAPDGWAWPASANLMVAYEMYDDTQRPLALSAGKLSAAVKRAGGQFALYNSFTNANRPDQWLTTFYGDLLNFMLPPPNRHKPKNGEVIIMPLEPTAPTAEPASAPRP